jgi:hypothetical protein
LPTGAAVTKNESAASFNDRTVTVPLAHGATEQLEYGSDSSNPTPANIDSLGVKVINRHGKTEEQFSFQRGAGDLSWKYEGTYLQRDTVLNKKDGVDAVVNRTVRVQGSEDVSLITTSGTAVGSQPVEHPALRVNYVNNPAAVARHLGSVLANEAYAAAVSNGPGDVTHLFHAPTVAGTSYPPAPQA